MKKFLIYSAILIALPSYAVCSIEGGETVCSLPGFREQVSPIYSPQTNINEFSGSPEARLKPMERSDIRVQTENFPKVESNYNYNSNCQFGVCLMDRNNTLFQKEQ